jgi:hypothetical protein
MIVWVVLMATSNSSKAQIVRVEWSTGLEKHKSIQAYVSQGVCIAKNLVLTCQHCIANYPQYKHTTILIEGRSANILVINENLCILEVKLDADIKPAKIGKEPKVGRSLTHKFYNKTKSEIEERPVDLTRARKVLSRKPYNTKILTDKVAKDYTFIPGQSGSGIFDSSGELVGIVQDVSGGFWNLEDIKKILNLANLGDLIGKD